MSKTSKQLALERLSDPEQMKKDHAQFEAWLKGETDEPPEIMKIKDGTPIPEIPPEQDVSNIEPFKSMLGLAWKQYLRKVRKKK